MQDLLRHYKNRLCQYTIQLRIFIVAHEILHCVMNHLVMLHRWRMCGKVAYPDGKVLDYDHGQMNCALDLVINAILIESNIGKFPKYALYDPNVATSKDTGVDIYRKIYKQPPPNGKSFDD